MERRRRRTGMKSVIRPRSSIYTLVGIGLSLVVIFYVAQHLNWALAVDRLTTANKTWLGAGLGVFAINSYFATPSS